ncbi:MAG: YdcF family protein [Propionicimonas sp.]|uniref:YdcF family protein n=1 Tax=Propionicimonas sp. TaxID=1955623 RepID=UPI001D7723AB|nr:YdcF family protein [Propionicimonas sp.]MBU4186599.1 YdcF family protein [Actinomycetota bacterium]MBU4205460.1 YdcF family protein [Actinomycetota bacterium]MBU4248745.1 YdcF family protein [Actinomycetota bacterium]MBU4365272.1 YdcF family protein [Actinomycetota bacterium]MBU4411174.1 YdcF family protein [Actinomycetota bacterium]
MAGLKWGRRALRAVLLVLGAAFTANAIWLALTANLTIGTGLAALLGLGFAAWGLWFDRARWPVVLAASLALAGLAGLSGFLVVYGSQQSATYDEDAVIVLGAAVHGDELSRTLVGRLDAALAYHQRNPSALIVVSGGQGPQENLPEGVAMGAYLTEHGVPTELVVVEDKATSTEENFAFAKALLDSRLPAGYQVVLVTDEFHVYRATWIAKRAGLTASHLGRATPWYFWAANFGREDLMVIKLWVTGS